jgi:hypothetical protein
LCRRYVRHLEQAPAGLLRGGAGPEDDRRGEHPLGRGQGAGGQARPLDEDRRAARLLSRPPRSSTVCSS